MGIAATLTTVSKTKVKQEQKSGQQDTETIKFDKEFVKILLIKEEGYSWDNAVLKINTSLASMSVKLQPVLDAYLADKKIDSTVNVKGVTMPAIMQGDKCDFWVALSHLNNFIYHPEDTSILEDPKLSRWISR